MKLFSGMETAYSAGRSRKTAPRPGTFEFVAESLHQPRVEPLAKSLLARGLAVAVLGDVQWYVELTH